MRKIILACSGVSICVLILTGCTSYIPPSLPPAKMAHVKEMRVGAVFVSVTSIDGVPTDSLAKTMGFTNPFKKEFWAFRRPIDVFDIKPGRRTLGVMLEQNSGFAHGLVRFVAEEGKVYHVMGYISEPQKSDAWWKADPQYVAFSVKDDVTGKIVSETN